MLAFQGHEYTSSNSTMYTVTDVLKNRQFDFLQNTSQSKRRRFTHSKHRECHTPLNRGGSCEGFLLFIRDGCTTIVVLCNVVSLTHEYGCVLCAGGQAHNYSDSFHKHRLCVWSIHNAIVYAVVNLMVNDHGSLMQSLACSVCTATLQTLK